MAIVIGYGPGPLMTPLTDAIRQTMTGTGLELRDVLRVDEGRYWSYLCQEPSCCRPEGVPFDISTHPAAATMAASGSAVLGDRDAVAATIAPVTGGAAETMTRETRRAERIAPKLTASTTGTESPAGHRPVTDEGLTAAQAAISTYREGGSIEHYGQFAWLALVLTSLRGRDDAWARMDPDHRHAHLRLWTDLTRHAQPGYIAAPASSLGSRAARRFRRRSFPRPRCARVHRRLTPACTSPTLLGRRTWPGLPEAKTVRRADSYCTRPGSMMSPPKSRRRVSSAELMTFLSKGERGGAPGPDQLCVAAASAGSAITALLAGRRA